MKTRTNDLKKSFITLIFVINLCLLCSCSKSSQSDTYFVHCAGFDKNGDNISVTVLLEKHGKDSGDYFTASGSASSIGDAAEKIMSEYSECYFATCDLYFITHSADSDTISAISKDICDSNVFPTTGDVLCVDSKTANEFMVNIKNADTIKKIKKDSSSSRVNVAAFFAKYESGESVTLNAFSVKDGKITNGGKATFSKN